MKPKFSNSINRIESMSKKIKFLGLFVLAASIMACGGDQKTTDGETETTKENEMEAAKPDMTGMEEIDLTEYDIPATIYAPDESKGKRTITATEWGSVQVESGKKFGIEIVPFGMTIEEKKAELSNASVYTIDIISEDANSIVFSKAINGTELEPEIHFFMTKEINGDVYEIKSLDNSYNQKAIEKMVNCANSFVEKAVG